MAIWSWCLSNFYCQPPLLLWTPDSNFFCNISTWLSNRCPKLHMVKILLSQVRPPHLSQWHPDLREPYSERLVVIFDSSFCPTLRQSISKSYQIYPEPSYFSPLASIWLNPWFRSLPPGHCSRIPTGLPAFTLALCTICCLHRRFLIVK